MSPDEKKSLREFLGLSEEQLSRVVYCTTGEIHRHERSEADAKKMGRASPNPLLEDFYVACKHLKEAISEGVYSVEELQKEFLASMAQERWAILGFFLHKSSAVLQAKKAAAELEAATLEEARLAEEAEALVVEEEEHEEEEDDLSDEEEEEEEEE